jgi:hypothetical protein
MSFGSKIADLVPQTRKTALLAKSTLIAKFFRMSHATGELLAQLSGFGQHAFGLLVHPRVGGAFHNLSFIVL